MSEPKTEQATQEKLSFDQVTHMMLSASLLGALMDILQTNRRLSTTVDEFYNSWRGTVQSKRFVPFNPGLILGYLYLSILFVQQRWTKAAPDLLPTDPQASDWGLSNAKIDSPKKTAPTVRYILRRIRNSLGHARVSIGWPRDVPIAKILGKVTIVFHDINSRDANDTFLVEMNVKDAFQLAKKYHVTTGELLAKQYGGTPIYDADWTRH